MSMRGLAVEVSAEALTAFLASHHIIPVGATIIKIIHSEKPRNTFDIICDWPYGTEIKEGENIRVMAPFDFTSLVKS